MNAVASLRVLVTGAAGFIGSHLVEQLLKQGAVVTGVDAFIDNYDPAVKRRNISAVTQHKNFALVEADIRDAHAVHQVVNHFKPDCIIHLAALAGVRPSIEQPALYTSVNVIGTTHLLDAAVKHRVSKFIFGSSSSVYGNNPKVPFSESDRVDGPISPYAATKRAGELIAHSYWHNHRLPVTCLRFFTVYGPRQRPDLAICKFMRCIAAGKEIPVFGDGSTQRDYTYVSDIISGIMAAVGQCEAFDIINLGSNQPISLTGLIQAIEHTLGKKAIINRQPMQSGDVERTFADLSHAQDRLGYVPAFHLARGLANQWAWLQTEDTSL